MTQLEVSPRDFASDSQFYRNLIARWAGSLLEAWTGMQHLKGQDDSLIVYIVAITTLKHAAPQSSGELLNSLHLLMSASRGLLENVSQNSRFGRRFKSFARAHRRVEMALSALYHAERAYWISHAVMAEMQHGLVEPGDSSNTPSIEICSDRSAEAEMVRLESLMRRIAELHARGVGELSGLRVCLRAWATRLYQLALWPDWLCNIQSMSEELRRAITSIGKVSIAVSSELFDAPASLSVLESSCEAVAVLLKDDVPFHRAYNAFKELLPTLREACGFLVVEKGLT